MEDCCFGIKKFHKKKNYIIRGGRRACYSPASFFALTPGTVTTRMISKFSESTVPAPAAGAIPCGTPEEEEENIQEYVSLPVSLFGKGEFYILKATGDSMADAGFEDGDLVVIRKQPEAMIGDIVAAPDPFLQDTYYRCRWQTG